MANNPTSTTPEGKNTEETPVKTAIPAVTVATPSATPTTAAKATPAPEPKTAAKPVETPAPAATPGQVEAAPSAASATAAKAPPVPESTAAAKPVEASAAKPLQVETKPAAEGKATGDQSTGAPAPAMASTLAPSVTRTVSAPSAAPVPPAVAKPAEPLAAAPTPSVPAAETQKPKEAAPARAPVAEASRPAEPVAPRIAPASVAAPAEPRSVHVEEPLPAEEPAPAEEPPPVFQSHHPRDLYIVQIAPEMAPVAKVGGLADVVFGLTRELAIRGNHVEIILPKYDCMRYDHIYGLKVDYQDLWVPWYEGAIHCTVHFGFVYDRRCFFIEPHSNDNFFNRGSIYGFQDDVMRYAFFTRAAMEFMWKANKHPDVIHCHDWQTALAPVYLYEFYQRMGMTHPRVCLTIHNYQHQGVTGGELLKATGLHDSGRFFDYNRMRDNHHQTALNLLKAGIVYSNFVTTVSPRYAFETKNQGQGFGLEPTLHTHHVKYGGVINGIDYDVWNPEIDGQIPVRYGVDSIEGKYDNKRALRHRLMLADNEKPIVAFIGRLDPQKGLELVRHAIFYTLERGAQFVLLGSSPYQHINNDFWGLKHMLNDSPDCHLEIGFNEELSHLIYAGADLMLVPSRFEPCGLTQLIALRYGTLPVVRSVGGLADTVFDKDYSDRPLHERNGYVFEHYDQAGLESALGRAIACYFEYPNDFREVMKNAMRSDYSWNRPGADYLNIYDYIREK
jgi:starch synthase